MTDRYANQPSAEDGRRAAALIAHHRRADRAGMHEIIRSAVDLGRPTELVLAIIDLYRHAIVELRTDNGIELLAAYVGQLAAADLTEPPGIDITRAAAVLDAHGRGDFPTIGATLQAASRDGRGAETLLELLQLYEVILPELTSEPGLDWLQRCIATFIADEEGDE